MSQDNSANNKRIAKNTLLLYVRMLFLMLISLYTSRVVLATLGIEDYGIYNVVGGVVSMFSILSSSLSSAVSRFLTFELGKGDFDKLSRVFSTSVIVQSLMALLVVIVAEVVGIWFLNNKMNIPLERMDAANWVMHCSILTFAIGLISVPYNATIVAHERMTAFAYVSVLEAMLKLSVVFAISISMFDKLKTYAVLLLTVSILIRMVYGWYCKRNFPECQFHFVNDRQLLKNMTGFAGWTMLGNGAWMFNTQGLNILINLFFGVTLNAARGVATQVEHAVMNFVTNFMTAVNPQITKSYAEGNLGYMHTLICRGAKYSFFLMLFFAVPICLETDQILSLWLEKVPDYAVDFVRLTFVTSMCSVIGNTLVTAQCATGKVKRYQIIVSIWGLWVFPLTWIAFEMGFSPVSAYLIYAFIYFVLIFIRIYLVKDLIKMPWKTYIKSVILKCAIVTLVSFVLPYVVYVCFEASILRLIEVVVMGSISVVGTIYVLGLDEKEKHFVIIQIRKRLWNH